jgi:hypothetical protein
VSKIEIERVTIGEHKHLILQALCRGAVRKCDGEYCKPMNAYIIAAPHTGIKSALPEVFPGCQIIPWQPVKRTLKGKVKEAFDYLKAWVETTREQTIAFRRVATEITMKSPDFSKDIRKHSDFQAAIAELGLIEYGPGQRLTCFYRPFLPI